jgi:hypothetical protein
MASTVHSKVFLDESNDGVVVREFEIPGRSLHPMTDRVGAYELDAGPHNLVLAVLDHRDFKRLAAWFLGIDLDIC